MADQGNASGGHAPEAGTDEWVVQRVLEYRYPSAERMTEDMSHWNVAANSDFSAGRRGPNIKSTARIITPDSRRFAREWAEIADPSWVTEGPGTEVLGIYVDGCFVSWEQMTLPMGEESDG